MVLRLSYLAAVNESRFFSGNFILDQGAEGLICCRGPRVVGAGRTAAMDGVPVSCRPGPGYQLGGLRPQREPAAPDGHDAPQ